MERKFFGGRAWLQNLEIDHGSNDQLDGFDRCGFVRVPVVSDDIDVGEPNLPLFQDIIDGLARKSVGMFEPVEPLLFHVRDHPAVDEESGRRIMDKG